VELVEAFDSKLRPRFSSGNESIRYLRGMRTGKYRSKLQIIVDILLVASKGAKKTWIMCRANLSYELLNRYLAEVMDAGLVSFVDGSDCYKITRKGQEFLACACALLHALKHKDHPYHLRLPAIEWSDTPIHPTDK